MKRERRCNLSDTHFPLLAFLLSSLAYARTEGARAKLPLCGDRLTPLVFCVHEPLPCFYLALSTLLLFHVHTLPEAVRFPDKLKNVSLVSDHSLK